MIKVEGCQQLAILVISKFAKMVKLTIKKKYYEISLTLIQTESSDNWSLSPSLGKWCYIFLLLSVRIEQSECVGVLPLHSQITFFQIWIGFSPKVIFHFR